MFRSVKITSSCDVTSCIASSGYDLKETCSKLKEYVIKRIFTNLTLNMAFIALVRRDFYNSFTSAKSCLTFEINTIFNVKSLNIINIKVKNF